MMHAPWCAILLSLLGCVEELEPRGVSLIHDDTRVETAVPACAVTDVPSCWHVEHDPVSCRDPEPAMIAIRGYTAYRPHVRGQCVIR
ncbi:MAG TPA: hypothetical protein VFS15_24955 [Kofleriaceae bacterium]|nr:hypothetical protein [Kofleriaceae bacterium]